MPAPGSDRTRVRSARLRTIAIAGTFGALVGIATTLAWVALGGDGAIVPTLFGLVVAHGLVRWWMRRTFPQRALAAARRYLDPMAGPPAGAEPVELPVARRWLTAGAEHDWDAFRALHTEDFRFHSPGLRRPLSRRRSLRIQRRRAALLGETRSTVERTLADPERPDTFWLRLHQHAQPRRGDALDFTRWERWTLTPERDRIRSRTVVAFTHAA